MITMYSIILCALAISIFFLGVEVVADYPAVGALIMFCAAPVLAFACCA